MEWKNKVPIFKNPVILKQLGIAIGIPFGLVAVVIGVTSGRSVDTLYALGLIGTLLLATWVFINAVHGGKYEAEFFLDAEGVLCRTQSKQARKNRIINGLTVVAGLLSGKPAVAGAGLLAVERQSVYIRWNRITKIVYQPNHQTILLRGGLPEHIALFCTKENYDLAERFVRNKVQNC
ncbi:MAG TPA: hypothetical protein VEA58_05575 [Anaerovoracaceae bacterium]|nr:hypothetical protein [Anaerovoracaceae bacterium]